MFSELFDLVPDGLIVVDGSGTITRANAQAERLFGYEPGTLAGHRIEVLIPPEARSRHQHQREAYMQSPRLRAMGEGGQSLVGLRRDGERFPVEIALSPLAAAGERVFLASVRDISESLRARQSLVRARYDALVARVGQLALATQDDARLFQQLPATLAEELSLDAVALLMASQETGRIEVRSAFGLDARLLREMPWQFPLETPLGKRMASGEPVFVDDLAASVDPLPDPALAAAGFRSNLLLPLSDHTRPVGALVALSRRPHRFDHDTRHCLQSVATLLASLIQRRATEEQLAHSQRLDAIGQLTGGIAHDFNNMLTVVSGNLQLLDIEHGGNAAARELIESALHAVEHGAALTGKLLAFARRQRLHPRAIAPEVLLRNVATLLRRTLGESIRIEIVCEAREPVFADSGQLEAALINLALNARDAMPRGGHLRIAASRLDVARCDDVDALDPGPYIVFEVVDTGHGMTPDVLTRIFEPFFTTKESGRGSGLGLSMVYGFVRQSGGRLRASSRLGYGTRMELILPMAQSESQAAPEAATVPLAGGNETILVVEDEAAVREVARAFLASLGYHVITAASAADALRQLEDDASIALLFSDVVLGEGMNGAELGERARRMRPGLPVLLTSGYEHGALPGAASGHLPFELISKPYRREELATGIRRQLDGAGSHPPQ